jgi:hypothetical protein
VTSRALLAKEVSPHFIAAAFRYLSTRNALRSTYTFGALPGTVLHAPVLQPPGRRLLSSVRSQVEPLVSTRRQHPTSSKASGPCERRPESQRIQEYYGETAIFAMPAVCDAQHWFTMIPGPVPCLDLARAWWATASDAMSRGRGSDWEIFPLPCSFLLFLPLPLSFILFSSR